MAGHHLGHRCISQGFAHGLARALFRRRAGVKHRHDFVDVDPVLILDRRATFQPSAFDIGAVQTRQVLNKEALVRLHDPGVLPGNGMVAQHDVAELVAAQ